MTYNWSFEKSGVPFTSPVYVPDSVAASGIEANVECKRIGLVVVGLEVPHTHIHLVPINQESDLSFSNPRVKLSQQEFEELAENISKSIG